MNGSLVPANTKRSTLVLGMFRPMPDLVILASGTIVTVALLAIFSNSATWLMILSLLPMLICVFLVLPVPNYHNFLCAIQSILNYYNGRKNYIWRGWCMQNEFKEDK